MLYNHKQNKHVDFLKILPIYLWLLATKKNHISTRFSLSYFAMAFNSSYRYINACICCCKIIIMQVSIFCRIIFLKAELKTIVLAVNFFRISWKNTQVKDELILLKRAKFIPNSKIRKTIEICVPVPFFHWPFCVKAIKNSVITSFILSSLLRVMFKNILKVGRLIDVDITFLILD